MPSSETTTLDAATVLADLAASAGLSPREIEPDEDFLGLGIDSVRLMRLLDSWRAAGVRVEFADLAACPTVSDAVALITRD